MGYISNEITPHGDRRWMDYALLEWVRIQGKPVEQP